MAFRRPKISILRILMVAAMSAVLFAAIAPNFIRAKHRISNEQICRGNLKRLENGLFEYKEKHGRYPETLNPFFEDPDPNIDGCLEVMPDPIFGVNRERYGADTYSPGYFPKVMRLWDCALGDKHGTEELKRECDRRLWDAREKQPNVAPNCPQTGRPLTSRQQDGFELWCPARHRAGWYYGTSSVYGQTMTQDRPSVFEVGPDGEESP